MKKFRQSSRNDGYDPKRFDDAMLKLYGEPIFLRGIRVMTGIAMGKATPEEVERYMREVANAVRSEHSDDARFYHWREDQLEARWGRESKFCQQYPGQNWLNLARFLVRAKETLHTAVKLAEVAVQDPLHRETFAASVYPKMVQNLETGAVRSDTENEEDFLVRQIEWTRMFGFLRVVKPYIECWVKQDWGRFAQTTTDPHPADDPKDPAIPTKPLLLPPGVDLDMEIIPNRELQEQIRDYQRQIDAQRVAMLTHLQSAEAQLPLSAAYLRSEVGDNNLLVTQASQKMTELLAQMDMEGLGQAAADAAKLKTRGETLVQQLKHLERFFAGTTIEGVTFDKDVIAACTLRQEELQAAETTEAQVEHFTQLLAHAREKLAAQEEAEARREIPEQIVPPEPSPAPVPAKGSRTRVQLEAAITEAITRLKTLGAEIAALMAADDPDYGEVGARSAEAKTLKTRLAELQVELEVLPPEVDPAIEIARVQTAITETTTRLKMISGEIAATLATDDPDYGEVGVKSAEAKGLKARLAELQAELEVLPPVPVVVIQEENEVVVDPPTVITVTPNCNKAESVDVVITAMRASFAKLAKSDRNGHRKLFDDGMFNIEFARDSDVVDQAQVAVRAAALQRALIQEDWDVFGDISAALERMAG
ncbi:MAG: hypothetical protein HY007_00070 [Candidatus Sungbacteria bacterium]|nr:hypothetical protein [Candidatus Sungbacteria bacterium]